MNPFCSRSLSFVSFALIAFVSDSAIARQPATSLRATVPVTQGPVQPDPIVVINRKAAKKALLSDEEVQTIQTLQSAISPTLVSSLSPDQTTIVIELKQTGEEALLRFLNVQDGSQIEIDKERFRGYVPVLGWQWRDSNIAVAIAHKSSHQLNEPEYVLLLVHRLNGSIKLKSLSFLQSLGSPLSLAPGGKRLLIMLNSEHAEGGKKDDSQLEDELKPTHYRIVDSSNGEEVQRFSLRAELYLSMVEWSSDATQVAFVRDWNSNPYNQPTRGESLTDSGTQEAMGLLSSKENFYLQQNALQIINLQTGQRSTVAAKDGDGSIFSTLAWSPDSKHLLVQMNEPVHLEGRTYPTYFWNQRRTFRVYDATLQEISRFDVPELSQSEDDGVTSFAFISPDEVVFNALNGMDLSLYSYQLQTTELRKIALTTGSYDTQIVVLPATREAIAPYSSYTSPPELYRIALNTGKTKQLTAFNHNIAKLNHTRSEPISFTLGNGERLTGILLQPAEAPFPPAKMPLVVWQEGGPMSSMTNSWSADVERPFALLPNFGFAVLVVPLYGRYGFGTERFNALYNGLNWGQIDIDAMAEIVQQAIALGYTTPGSVGITGCSYGGYFTAQSIIRHPHLYAAANAQCSLLDADMDWKSRGNGVAAFLFGPQTPFANVARFHQSSPLYQADQVKTPLLLFHGNRDFLPVTFVENFYWLVASQGTPARMVKFIGAEHGLDTSEYQLYAAQEMIQWFRNYLKP